MIQQSNGINPAVDIDLACRRGGRSWLAAAVVAGVVLAFGMSASDVRSATPAGPITITMLANTIHQAALNVLIPNFERVYPNIRVNVTYEGTETQYALTTSELAAGDAPDLIIAWPGCGSPISICLLAKDGYLAPMVGVPWTRFSSRVVISESKYQQGLFVYSPGLSFYGMYTNDSLFHKLGLTVPQTFSQLLALCHKASADGTVAILLPGANPLLYASLAEDLALTTVYAHDSHWQAELQAGKVSFEATPGWHQALQELVAMDTAGCFQPGAVGTQNATPLFAQGQGLMTPGLSSIRATIVAAAPQFRFSQHPFPNGTNSTKTVAMLTLSSGPAINAHASAANQAAAQTFVNFIARPKQDALWTQVSGSISQYQFLKGQLPGYLDSFAPFLADHQYARTPGQTWWNANVTLAFQQNGVGLLTGQASIDEILSAVDSAWRQGPT
jgi:raffinose/stachyose/melibiose transport system substrate-binding protein